MVFSHLLAMMYMCTFHIEKASIRSLSPVANRNKSKGARGHPLEPTPLDAASGDWPKLIATLEIPNSTLLSPGETTPGIATKLSNFFPKPPPKGKYIPGPTPSPLGKIYDFWSALPPNSQDPETVSSLHLLCPNFSFFFFIVT